MKDLLMRVFENSKLEKVEGICVGRYFVIVNGKKDKAIPLEAWRAL